MEKARKEYTIHEISPFIDWTYFFKFWDFGPEYATIARIQGCDVCRATWLTKFEEDKRTKAAEAMQLLKEANRMLELLDRDYSITVRTTEQGESVSLDEEVQLLFEKDDKKRKMVKTLSECLLKACERKLKQQL